MTDTDRINFLAKMAELSFTGVSLEATEGRYRVIWYHNPCEPADDIRQAIDNGISYRARQEAKAGAAA